MTLRRARQHGRPKPRFRRRRSWRCAAPAPRGEGAVGAPLRPALQRRETRRRTPSDRYAHFVIQTHAGAKAPLGWALSKTAREALRAQLTQPKNSAALTETRHWLQGNLTCPGYLLNPPVTGVKRKCDRTSNAPHGVGLVAVDAEVCLNVGDLAADNGRNVGAEGKADGVVFDCELDFVRSSDAAVAVVIS